MTLDRRSFLRRTSLALAGGLLLGDQALDAFERLTHRKVFALGGLRRITAADLNAIYRKTNRDIMEAMRTYTEEYAWFDDADDAPKSLFASPLLPHNEIRLILPHGSHPYLSLVA